MGKIGFSEESKELQDGVLKKTLANIERYASGGRGSVPAECVLVVTQKPYVSCALYPSRVIFGTKDGGPFEVSSHFISLRVVPTCASSLELDCVTRRQIGGQFSQIFRRIDILQNIGRAGFK